MLDESRAKYLMICVAIIRFCVNNLNHLYTMTLYRNAYGTLILALSIHLQGIYIVFSRSKQEYLIILFILCIHDGICLWRMLFVFS